MPHDTATIADERMRAASAELQPPVKLPRHKAVTTHRTPDTAPEPELPPTRYIAHDEAQAIRIASRPLAKARDDIAALRNAMHELPMDDTRAARRQALHERAEELEREAAGDARGMARSGVLAALDTLTNRAAAGYVAASRMVDEEAARYVAAAELRDEALRMSRFDPMGLWSRVGALLAPEPAHRPRGCQVVADAFGRECLWTSSSDAFRQRVAFHKAAIKAELQGALNGAGWPFEGA